MPNNLLVLIRRKFLFVTLIGLANHLEALSLPFGRHRAKVTQAATQQKETALDEQNNATYQPKLTWKNRLLNQQPRAEIKRLVLGNGKPDILYSNEERYVLNKINNKITRAHSDKGHKVHLLYLNNQYFLTEKLQNQGRNQTAQILYRDRDGSFKRTGLILVIDYRQEPAPQFFAQDSLENIYQLPYQGSIDDPRFRRQALPAAQALNNLPQSFNNDPEPDHSITNHQPQATQQLNTNQESIDDPRFNQEALPATQALDNLPPSFNNDPEPDRPITNHQPLAIPQATQKLHPIIEDERMLMQEIEQLNSNEDLSDAQIEQLQGLINRKERLDDVIQDFINNTPSKPGVLYLITYNDSNNLVTYIKKSASTPRAVASFVSPSMLPAPITASNNPVIAMPNATIEDEHAITQEIEQLNSNENLSTTQAEQIERLINRKHQLNNAIRGFIEKKSSKPGIVFLTTYNDNNDLVMYVKQNTKSHFSLSLTQPTPPETHVLDHAAPSTNNAPSAKPQTIVPEPLTQTRPPATQVPNLESLTAERDVVLQHITQLNNEQNLTETETQELSDLLDRKDLLNKQIDYLKKQAMLYPNLLASPLTKTYTNATYPNIEKIIYPKFKQQIGAYCGLYALYALKCIQEKIAFSDQEFNVVKAKIKEAQTDIHLNLKHDYQEHANAAGHEATDCDLCPSLQQALNDNRPGNYDELTFNALSNTVPLLFPHCQPRFNYGWASFTFENQRECPIYLFGEIQAASQICQRLATDATKVIAVINLNLDDSGQDSNGNWRYDANHRHWVTVEFHKKANGKIEIVVWDSLQRRQQNNDRYGSLDFEFWFYNKLIRCFWPLGNLNHR